MTIATDTKIYFEHPLNDPMRICLCLEKLFNKLSQSIHRPDVFNSQNAIKALLQIIDVIGRPDLKSKLTQTLSQLATSLAQLEQFDQVDPYRLRSILRELDESIKAIMNQKIGSEITKNEFLKQLRLQLANPGGLCPYKSKSYHLWLNMSAEMRGQHLRAWHHEFIMLEKIVNLILKVTRDCGHSQQVFCNLGFHQQTLNPNLSCELIRIGIDADAELFPEISAGKHRISIRLMQPEFIGKGRAMQTPQTIPIDLILCHF